MIRRANGTCMTRRKALLSVICLAEAIIVAGSTAACGGGSNAPIPRQEQGVSSEAQQEQDSSGEAQQEQGTSNEAQQEQGASSEAQQEQGASSEAQQEQGVSSEAQQKQGVSSEAQQGQGTSSEAPNDTVPSNGAGKEETPSDPVKGNNGQSGRHEGEQISIDDAKQAALADAGLTASDVTYTKEKPDYEDGIAVYDIEFYADNVEYEYEINAATGAVYSKSVETHRTQAGHGHNEHGHDGWAGASGEYISDAAAKAIALDHAGVAEAEVSRFKLEFDIDDGQAVYEVEFRKDGREYEYKIDALNGSIVEYEVD